MTTEQSYSSEVIVVGSGPGGATVARELVRNGRQVLLLERGVDERGRFYYGTYPGALKYCDRMSLLFTSEGLNIIRPLMLGGATSMYCGCAALPPEWLKTRYGVNIDAEVAETITELAIRPLDPELRGAASTRIAQAAGTLDYEWFPQPKFMQPLPGRFRCRATCMLGCRCGAKWNAAEYVDEAVSAGLKVITRARVSAVLHEDSQVVGVQGIAAGKPFTARSEIVVLAAGGIGTPRLLQASGIRGAGEGMAMDTTVMVYGFSRFPGIGQEPPMTWSWENDREGYMLSTLIDPWLLYPIMAARQHWTKLFTWHRWKRILGIMIKLKDEISGGVFADGRISKPLTNRDQKRLSAAETVCRKILVEAGAEPDTIFRTPLRGTHPSGTVRIGSLVGTDLQTEIQGLYVCDASVFPEALDRPTVLTIIGLGKRLARHLGEYSGISA